LGMVAGTGGAGGPGGATVGGEFVIETVFPPTGPNVFEPLL
jgi:hypothetical protein